MSSFALACRAMRSSPGGPARWRQCLCSRSCIVLGTECCYGDKAALRSLSAMTARAAVVPVAAYPMRRQHPHLLGRPGPPPTSRCSRRPRARQLRAPISLVRALQDRVEDKALLLAAWGGVRGRNCLADVAILLLVLDLLANLRQRVGRRTEGLRAGVEQTARSSRRYPRATFAAAELSRIHP
jgi:hypothetical protein